MQDVAELYHQRELGLSIVMHLHASTGTATLDIRALSP